VVGVIGCLQAVEAIKTLTGVGEPLRDRLLIADLLRMQWRTLRLKADPACPVCAGQGASATPP
jgi:molybdopterin-synthase adenylyltransferase